MNFELRKGEIHALVGENGAGKSTMINVMSGVHTPDSGEIIFEDSPIVIDNSPTGEAKGTSAKQLGIAVVHQELLLCDKLSAAENIYLGALPGHLLVDWKKVKDETLKNLRIIDDSINPDDIVENLTAAQRQMVEITKAISTNCKVLIMDEPTTSLAETDVEKLLSVVKKLKDSGISIIYISHKLEEVFSVSDRITVIRDGQYVGTVDNKAEIQRDDIVKMMVGRSIKNYYVRNGKPSDETVFEVKDLTGLIVKHASFELKKGEILGFSGLVGAGRTELMRMVFGIDEHMSGQIVLEGKDLKIRKPGDAIQSGIVYVPEDRKTIGLFLAKDIGFNMSISSMDQFISFLKVNKNYEDGQIESFKKLMDIKMEDRNQIVASLSGGNQQKILIARWIFAQPKILILDEPTKGIDIGAKADIYQLLDNLTSQGISIIIVSSELPEIIGMCDRVYVMQEQTIRGCIKKESMTQEAVMHLATGGEK